MSSKTEIAWCDSTVNAVIGCTKVSAGCASCYAAVDTPARVLRHRGIETWGPSGVRVPVKGFEKSMLAMNRKPWIENHTGKAFSNEELSPGFNSEWYHRRRVFCDSNSDWLDEKWPIETLAHFLDVLRRCPDITLILCTKRPENFFPRMKQLRDFFIQQATQENYQWGQLYDVYRDWLDSRPPGNVVILTSVENQPMADLRVPQLLKIPAACHGLSMEPLLCDIKLKVVGNPPIHLNDTLDGVTYNKLDWYITGGESGPNARPCNVDWIRSLVEQGKAAGVATFCKQLGSHSMIHVDGVNSRNRLRDKKGGDMAEWPEDLRVQQWPKGF